jgi:hypothetical protein
VFALRRHVAVQRARKNGRSIATAVSGRDPTLVEYDGMRQGSFESYRSLSRYKADVQSRRVSHRTARCCGRPPRVGDRVEV